MRRATITAAALFLASLLWVALITLHSPWEDGSGAMIGVSLISLAAVSTVGVLVAGSRWARRLAVAVVAVGALLAVTVEIGVVWLIALALSVFGAAEALGSGLNHLVGRRPSASGPPAQAIAIPLIALGWPASLAIVQQSGVDLSDWLAALTMIAIGFWYTKALTGSVWLTRLVAPLAAPLSLWLAGAPEGLVPAAAIAALTAFAWTRNARVSAAPLIEKGTAVPIPAELAPGDVLDAAGLDDRGRRTER